MKKILQTFIALSALSLTPVLYAQDADWDGLNAADEAALGWSDNNRDSDSDGVIDGLEGGHNVLMSVNINAPASTNSDSKHIDISDDGRLVSYYSDNPVLVAGDQNGTDDVFLTDVVTGQTTLVSAHQDGTQCDASAWNPHINGDGRYVVFSSFCTNLTDSYVSGQYVQVYVKDMQTGVVELISKTPIGTPASGHSQYPEISRDGRYVAFSSTASNLVASPSGNYANDVYLYDRLTGDMKLASLSLIGTHSNGNSVNPEFSQDGRFLTYNSTASNLVIGDTNNASDVFVYELATGTTERVSVDSNGMQGSGWSTYPSLSADGRFVVFNSWNQFDPADTNNKLDAYLHDRLTGITELISVDTNGSTVSQHSIANSVSANGRYVFFRSQVRSLTFDTLPPSQYPPTTYDIPLNVDFFAYVRDRELGMTTLLTRPLNNMSQAAFVEEIAVSESGVAVFHAKGGIDSWVEYDPSSGFDVFITKAPFSLVDNKGPVLHAGKAEGIGDGAWTRISLPDHYANPVIVTTPIYDSSSVPLVTRISNIESDGFNLKVQRADNGVSTVNPVSVNYVVVEAGIYNVAEHGIDLEAGVTTSTTTDGKFASWNGVQWWPVNSYNSPVVLGQVMSYNDPLFSVFWAHGGNNKGAAPNHKIYLGKHLGEDTNTQRAAETLGYIILETSNGPYQNGQYEAMVTADYIRGMNNGSYQVNLSNSATDSIVIASPAGMDGGDGGWPVIMPGTTDNFGFSVAVDEDQLNDNERNHTTEQISVLSFTPAGQ